MTTNRISLLTTSETRCDYLPQALSITHFIDPATRLDPVLYGQLLENGFRRSGDHVYRPGCKQCQRCQSLKISPAEFRASRSQKRCLKKNDDLRATPMPAVATEEYYDLYFRYINCRHGDGSMANPSQSAFADFLISQWCDTLFVEFRLANKLIAVTVVDVLPKGLSAVYTFYDPEEAARGLGNLAVLWQLETALKHKLPWVYLGYWIEGHEKMHYKCNYQPALIFKDHSWQRMK